MGTTSWPVSVGTDDLPTGGCTEVFIFVAAPEVEWDLHFDVPKSWRWYDVFRKWQTPNLSRNLRFWHFWILRVQEKFSLKQRAARKRRAYLQALYAL
jgi:hypothetical protein